MQGQHGLPHAAPCSLAQQQEAAWDIQHKALSVSTLCHVTHQAGSGTPVAASGVKEGDLSLTGGVGLEAGYK